jgi:hypothetical protein
MIAEGLDSLTFVHYLTTHSLTTPCAPGFSCVVLFAESCGIHQFTFSVQRAALWDGFLFLILVILSGFVLAFFAFIFSSLMTQLLPINRTRFSLGLCDLSRMRKQPIARFSVHLSQRSKIPSKSSISRYLPFVVNQLVASSSMQVGAVYEAVESGTAPPKPKVGP